MNDADAAPEFDTLAIVQKLEGAGVSRPQAEAHAGALRNGRAGLAAGADIARLEGRMDGLAAKADIARLEGRMDGMATKADLAVLEARVYRALWMQAGAIIGIQAALAGIAVALAGLIG